MIKMLNYTFKLLSVVLLCCSIGVMTIVFYFYKMIPESFNIIEGEEFALPNAAAVGADSILDYNKTNLANRSTGASQQVQLKLFNVIPIKTTMVNVIDEPSLTPGGTPFGIKLFTKGVMVIDTADVQTSQGVVSPAKLSGIAKGDVILSLDSVELHSNEQVAGIIENSNGEPLAATILRDKSVIKTVLTPVISSVDGKLKSGIWVRDSSAGIGTVTYYLKDSNRFAGLGHGICDVDTGKLMPLESGEVCEVSINSVLKGHVGTPGELRGSFKSNTAIGKLETNNEAGIFGILNQSPNNFEPTGIKLKQEVKVGNAKIICTLDSTGPQEYDINIDKIDLNPKTVTKNMMITVTDPELISKTGGIVQGMSGSPIVQDGKIIGAVTHVFVNNPKKGYGIFVENMLNFTNKLAKCG